jgi:hypothetical protein
MKLSARLVSPLSLCLLVGACGASASPVQGDDVEVDGSTIVDATPLQDFCNATDPRTVPVTIAATPEAGEAPYLEALAGAQHSISVEIYLMGYGGILDQLVAKAQATLTA